MIRLFLLSLVLLNFHTLKSQRFKQLHMENGDILIAKVIKQDGNNIDLLVLSEKTIAESEVLEIRNWKADSRLQKEKGLFNHTSFGMLLGPSSNENSALYGFIHEIDYAFKPYLASGLCIGVEVINETVLPIGLNLKLRHPNLSRLYLNISGGYSFSLEKPEMEVELASAAGGYFSSIGLRYDIVRNENNCFFMSGGYRYNTLNYKYEGWWRGETERKYEYNRIEIRFGVSFY